MVPSQRAPERGSGRDSSARAPLILPLQVRSSACDSAVGRQDTLVAHPVLPVMSEARMNKDELDGKTESVKGKIKQGVGDLTDNDRVRDEGAADEVKGDVQEGFGKARRKVGEAIEDVGDKLKD